MSTIKANRIENLTTTNGGIDINNSGNVGISTSSPTTPLSVRNSSTISTYGAVSAQFSDNSTGTIYVQHSSGKVQLGSDSALAFGSGSSATERMRILPSGGLTFNGDTAAANALDDYEEGTFTPGYNSALGSPSYVVQSGHYTKVGNCVTFTLTLNATGINTGDQLLILGLPFTASSTLENGGATINYFSGNSGNLTQYAHIGKNLNYISFYLGSGNAWVGVSGDGVSGKTFHLNGFYYV